VIADKLYHDFPELAEGDLTKMKSLLVCGARLSEVAVEFETSPELMCGVELRAAGREISWTVASYVQGLHDALASGIDAKLKAPAQAPEANDAAEPAPAEATDPNE